MKNNMIKDSLSVVPLSDINNTSPPKRPRTAYIFYTQEQYSKSRDKNNGLSFANIGQQWKLLPLIEKQIYIDKALADKERYANEIQNYVPLSPPLPQKTRNKEQNDDKKLTRTKLKKNKKEVVSSSVKVKKGPNPYNIFSKDMRQQHKNGIFEGLTFSQISKQLSQMWKNLSADEIGKYKSCSDNSRSTTKKLPIVSSRHTNGTTLSNENISCTSFKKNNNDNREIASPLPPSTSPFDDDDGTTDIDYDSVDDEYY